MLPNLSRLSISVGVGGPGEPGEPGEAAAGKKRGRADDEAARFGERAAEDGIDGLLSQRDATSQQQP